MIIPVILNLEVTGDYDHLPVFYYYLSMLQKYDKRAIISHERYFMNMEQADKLGVNASSLKNFVNLFEFQLPTDEMLHRTGKYMIPQQLEDEIAAEFKTKLDAWAFLLGKNHLRLESLLGSLLDQIETDFQESVEAILCFYAPVALRKAAKERGIAVIHQEMSMFRPPAYEMKSGYFDLKEDYGFGELEGRYLEFQEEIKSQSVPILETKEILAVSLKRKFLRDIHLMDLEPEYELGISPIALITGPMLRDGLITTEEMIYQARRCFAPDKIRIRHRLEAARKTDPDSDNSSSAFHFIVQCRRIAAARSNISFEAMLLGRSACILGHSPFMLAGIEGIQNTATMAPLDFVNFTTFGYFVPWEWMTDWEYIRYRLSKPSQVDIYIKHVSFHFKKIGINLEQAEMMKERRLVQFMALRGADLTGRLNGESKTEHLLIQQPQDDRTPSCTLEELKNQYVQLKQGYVALEEQYRLLAAGESYLRQQYYLLESSYKSTNAICKTLESEHLAAQSAYETLQSAYETLQSAYETSQVAYGELQKNIVSIQDAYIALQGEYTGLQKHYQTLSQEHKNLQTSYVQLQEQYKQQQDLLSSKRPFKR